MRRADLHARIRTAVLTGFLAAFATLAGAAQEPLPQPLELGVALGSLAHALPREQLALDHRLTAVQARAYECHALDRPHGSTPMGGRHCGYWHLLTPRQQTTLQVMRRFLNVLEADLTAARDEEFMAIAYVRVDRGRNREELGQFSSIELKKLELEYQQSRRDRYASQARLRVSRSLLASALGRSGELPADVAPPQWPSLPASLGDVDALLEEASAGNPSLNDWRQQADTGNAPDYLVRQLETDLHEAILQLWLGYGVLLVDRQREVALADHRDLCLERSRTLYDLEATADLGDCMAEQTAAKLAQLRTDHRLYMLLATSNALRGRPLLPLIEERTQGGEQ